MHKDHSFQSLKIQLPVVTVATPNVYRNAGINDCRELNGGFQKDMPLS